MAGFGLDELALFVLLLTAGGLGSGFLAGLFGVGGGLLIVPVLALIFSIMGFDLDTRLHLAVGTSLAMIVPTSVRSVIGHYYRGAVDVDLLGAWARPLLAGVVLGAVVAGSVDGEVLAVVFATAALLMAAYMAFAPPSLKIADTLPHGPANGALAGGIGLLSVMIGVGGGTLGTIAMTLFGKPIHAAVGTSSGLGALIAIPGTAGFVIGGLAASSKLPPFSLGYVSLPALLVIVPCTIFAAPYGVRAAHALSARHLKRAYAAYLTVMSLRMIAEIFA